MRIRKEKEKEVARLRALQERARDHQAEQDALRAKRNQVHDSDSFPTRFPRTLASK